MAGSNSTVSVPVNRFNSATLKLEGAKALISALGIFIGETTAGDGEMPVTGSLMSEAMSGIRQLIDCATDDLMGE